MKLKIVTAAILILIGLSGCSRRNAVEYNSLAEKTAAVSISEESDGQKAEEEEAAAEAADQDAEVQDVQSEGSLKEEETASLYVDISGAVLHPGVYELPSDNRIFHAIAAAGGLTEAAEVRCINQADPLYDGEKIYIYTREEAESLGGWMELLNGSDSGGKEISAGGSGQSTEQQTGKVNLNTADKSQLMSLAGVGEARANAILAYRETNGAFSGIEEIMNVSGIKEGLYEQIRDYITV